MSFKIFFIFNLVFIFILGDWICAQAIKDNFEPNNKIDQAKEISFEVPYIFELETQEDQDWFSFAIPQGQKSGYVTFNTGGFYDSQRYFFLEVFDQNKKSLFEKSQQPPKTLLLSQGKYFFKLSHREGQLYKKQCAHVFLSFNENMDAREPNDTQEQAHSIPLNQYHGLYLFHEGDVDVFRFEISKSGYFRVFVDKSGRSKTYYDLFYKDKNQKMSTQEYNWIRLEQGTYFITFSRQHDWQRLWPGRYKFYLMYKEEKDPLGGANFSRETAQEFQLGSVTSFYNAIPLDKDFFKVEISQDAAYFFMLSPSYKTRIIQTEICPQDKKEGDESCHKFTSPSSYQSLKKGTYTIHFSRVRYHQSFLDQKFEFLLTKVDEYKSSIDFYIIDIEGNEKAIKALKKVADAAQGRYVLAKSEREMTQAIQKAARQKPKSWIWLLMIILLFLVGGGGFYFYKKRKTSSP